MCNGKTYKICKILFVILSIFFLWLFMNYLESVLHIKTAGSVNTIKKKQKMGHGTNAARIWNEQ